MNRKGLIAGAVVLFAMLGLLIIGGVGFLWFRLKSSPSQAHQRSLIPSLTYCNSQNLKPCIVSFSSAADGNMLVNMLISSSYPNFYLTISNAGAENKYQCQPVKDFPTNIYCTGNEMYPGETLQFTLLSFADNSVLAEGKLAIIGLLLETPMGEISATPTETEGPTESPTPLLLEILTPLATKPLSITPVVTAPTPTELTPSYPNPSYP